MNDHTAKKPENKKPAKAIKSEAKKSRDSNHSPDEEPAFNTVLGMEDEQEEQRRRTTTSRRYVLESQSIFFARVHLVQCRSITRNHLCWTTVSLVSWESVSYGFERGKDI